MLFLTSCGIVTRTITPNKIYIVKFNLSRDVHIFAPKGYKIYYSTQGQNNFIFDGVSDGGKHVISFSESHEASAQASNWSTWTTADANKIHQVVSRVCRERAYTTLWLQIVTPDGYVYLKPYNLWGWYSNGNLQGDSIPYMKKMNDRFIKNSISEVIEQVDIEYYPISIEL